MFRGQVKKFCTYIYLKAAYTAIVKKEINSQVHGAKGSGGDISLMPLVRHKERFLILIHERNYLVVSATKSIVMCLSLILPFK